MPPLHRYIGNPVLSLVGRVFFGIPVRDFHCGIRGFRRDKAMALGLRSDGMEFASEIIVKFALTDASIVEVPTVLRKDGRDRPPHLRSWRDGWRHLKFLLTYAPKWLFFYPGAALALAGLVLLAALLPGNLPVGNVRLGVHTLLFAAAGIIIGAQLMSFAVLARLFGVREKLWPSSPRTELARRWFTIDRGCVAGAVMLVAGIALAVTAVMGWAGTGYGDMDSGRMMRLAIPSVLLCSLGVQALVTGFFATLLTAE